MLYELLRQKGRVETDHLFPQLADRSLVYEIFERFGPKGDLQYWAHAEEFLDFVDTAAVEKDDTNARRRVLKQLMAGSGPQMTMERFRDLAILAVAAECSPHVELGSRASEAWQPYMRWAKSRRKSDAIITFNYDEVVEKLGAAPDVQHISQESVMLPMRNALDPDLCQVFKVHGSVKWAYDDRNGREPFKHFGNIQGFTLEDGYRPLIATPGITKKTHCDNALENIWRAAMTKLRSAEVVVFMGYRFPPSDSFARTSILAALQQNESVHLRIHTVLGPDVRHENTVRLVSMLTHILQGKGRIEQEPQLPRDGTQLRTYAIVPQPLYVEDFLSIFHPRMLYGASNFSEELEP